MNIDLSALGPLAGSLARAGLPTLGTILSDAAPFPVNLFVRPVFAAITAALGVDPNSPTAATQVQAKVDADPDGAAAKLQTIEDEHKNALDAAQAELDARLKDVQDARSTEVEYVKAGSRIQYAPAIISFVVVVGFYAIIFAVFHYTTDLSVNQAALLNILIGASIAGFTQAVNFWLGSSSSSKNKDDALITMAKAPQVIQGPGSHVSGGIAPAKKR